MGNQTCSGAPSPEEWVHEILFPMYVLKVSDFLQMSGRPKAHSFLKDMLHVWKPGMFVIFVSHQWLSKKHPDPSGYQSEVLRSALQGLTDGSLRLALDGHWVFFADERKTTSELQSRIPEAYIWLDWFAIPQITHRASGVNEDVTKTEAAKAIQSIPGYVERCNLFMILTPELFHEDTGMLCNTRSWQSRGWCMAELLCHQLSNKKDATIITLRSARHAELNVWQIEWDALWESQFTVEEDRLVVLDFVRKMVESKIRHERERGFLSLSRYLTAGQFKLGGSKAKAEDADEFLTQFQFYSIQESAHDRSSMPGLLCAVLSGDVSMIRSLVKSLADVNLRCHGLEEMFRQPDNHTPLMVACRSKQAPEVLSTLIQLQADVNACCPFGLTVLNWAQTPWQVRVLVSAKADLESLNRVGNGPLANVCGFADAETVAEMIACGCEVHPSVQSFYPLHCLVSTSRCQSVEKAKMLIAHKADVNVRASTTGTGMFACVCYCSQMASYMSDFASLSAATKLFGSLEGITPLGMAAFFGDHALTRCLLDADADPRMSNARGDLPINIATALGHEAVAAELLNA